MTWPLGPEEAQDWFWATARESMTTLGFYVHYWSEESEIREYYHYISQILNHDASHAVTALQDLLKRLPLTSEHTELSVWADCGPHFRCYEFAWAIKEQCDKRFENVILNFHAEHHGTGRCDGAFGLQRRWVNDYARNNTIGSLQDIQTALETGASGTMVLDPPPGGPAYKIVNFKPTKPAQIKKLDAGPTTLSIEYTYCLQFKRGQRGVELYSLVFSDRISGERILPLSHILIKTDAEWRMSYRKTAPEKDPLNVALLARRREKQLPFASSGKDGACRRTSFMKAMLQRERRAVKQKSKAARTKAVLAVNLAEAADSSSSSSSSSS